MMVDCDMMAGQADQTDLYCRHNFGMEAYSESFAQEEFGSEPEYVGISNKNQGSSFGMNYMCQRIDH